MKKFICAFLSTILLANAALADTTCNWSTIKLLPDGNYEYPAALNLCVGQLVQTNKIQLAQIADLQSAIQLKDLALTNADGRTQLWMTTSLAEQDRLTKIDSDSKTNNFIYFGLGVLATIGTGFAVAKLVGK